MRETEKKNRNTYRILADIRQSHTYGIRGN